MRLPLFALVVLMTNAGVRAEDLSLAPDTKAESSVARNEYRSEHFLLHSDLPKGEADLLLARLEALVKFLGDYWGRPLREPIECYVVKDVRNWPKDSLDAEGRKKIEQGVGITLVDTELIDGRLVRSKAVIYCAASTPAVLHEAVHAYCGQEFGATGPLWYAEGMAEIGRYWRDGDSTINASPAVLKYLRSAEAISVEQLISQNGATGDSWKNYARRWALCHLLMHNPNYSQRFRALGLAYLRGADQTFAEHFGPVAQQLEFEHEFFVGHVCEGFRADLCAWDWTKTFKTLKAGQHAEVKVQAHRGWQPTGVTIEEGVTYDISMRGRWHTGVGKGSSVAANGQHSEGPLRGVVLRDWQLSKPFVVGTSFMQNHGGDLYLRCSDEWKSLADNDGELQIRLTRSKSR